MKKYLIFSMFMGMLCVPTLAQDDMYFTPSKQAPAAQRPRVTDTPVYHSGSTRDVDEYNRRHLHSSYTTVAPGDSLYDDVINFSESDGYPTDSIDAKSKKYDEADDFTYSRRMARFDDFYGWYDPYFFDYWYPYGGYWRYPYWRTSYWGWYSPWYDPWYYGYYPSWYYYGWGYGPRYYGSVHHHGTPVTRNHGRITPHHGGGANFGHGNVSRGTRGTFGGRGLNSGFGSGTRSNVGSGSRSNGSFTGSAPSGTRSHSSGSSGFGSRGGSFGGSHSGGGFGGGFGGGSRGGGGFGGGSHGGSRGGFGGRR